MIPNIKLIIYGIALAAILGAGLYVRHLHKEARRVPALIETINDLHAQAKAEREQAQKSLEQEAEIRKRLAASDDRAARLASRLRARLAELPPPPVTPEPPGASGDGSGDSAPDVGSGGVIGAINDTLAACQRDAIRLNGWIDYYRRIPEELSGGDTVWLEVE